MGSSPTLDNQAQYFCTRSAALFFCLIMLSADLYIDVRERLQVNDLFMHMLVDTYANCESRTDLLVTPRLGASSG